jgi:hypothetical protein
LPVRKDPHGSSDNEPKPDPPRRPPLSDDQPTANQYETDPDSPLPLPKPRTLLREPGFLAEDLRQIAFREPDNYRHWCITADHMLNHCDSDQPIMVSRTHRETHDGQELLFVLLVFRPQTWMPMMPSVLFGEIALSPELYDELVREIGTYRPLPQKAKVPDQYEQTPEELEDERWAELLNGQCRVEEDDEFEMPF